jgi:hypothetical protein
MTSCFYLVSFSEWDYEKWSHEADDDINHFKIRWLSLYYKKGQKWLENYNTGFFY